MERTTWTDERLDERMAAIDHDFEHVFVELRASRSELKAEIRELRADFNHFQDRMVQVGFALVTALIAAIVTIVLALS